MGGYIYFTANKYNCRRNRLLLQYPLPYHLTKGIESIIESLLITITKVLNKYNDINYINTIIII